MGFVLVPTEHPHWSVPEENVQEEDSSLLRNQPAQITHTPSLGLDFGEWPLGDGKTEAQTELVACPRSPNKFPVELRLECSSPDLQSDKLSTPTVVESSYHWSTICPRPVRLASLASRLATGGDGVVQD